MTESSDTEWLLSHDQIDRFRDLVRIVNGKTIEDLKDKSTDILDGYLDEKDLMKDLEVDINFNAVFSRNVSFLITLS